MSAEVGTHHVYFGHRRLAILDLSPAGHQPMQTDSGRYSIVFNGEIYNHADLRHSLKDIKFYGHSDTETILHLLAQQGISGLGRFNGIFALAFLDSECGKLLLARDPFGVKPLYYHFDGSGLTFCSEIRPLLALRSDALDVRHLGELLRLRYSPSPHTLFRNVRKLRPGHYLEVDLKSPSLTFRECPYFDRIRGAQFSMPFSEALERYADLFEEAVSRQLMSDVEIGMLLSGGIDSALVASFAQRGTDRPMKAFTVGFDERDDADEIDDARETASVLGMEHHHIRIGFGDFLDTFRKCVDIVEEPLATTSIIPMHHLAELAAGHVKVVLSGQGADELMGGYGRYQGELYRRLMPALAFKAAGRVSSLFGLRDEQMLRGFRALKERDDRTRFLNTYTVFDQKEIERLIGVRDSMSEESVGYYYDLLRLEERSHSVDRMMSIDLRMSLPDDLLLYTDKITMYHSVECRVPILDMELAGFVESLPPHFRVRLRSGKFIHKRLAHRMLPRAIIARKKKGFSSPTYAWFKNIDKLRSLLLESATRFSAYFDLREVDRVLVEHQRGYNRERQIFLLISLYHWLEAYG